MFSVELDRVLMMAVLSVLDTSLGMPEVADLGISLVMLEQVVLDISLGRVLFVQLVVGI